MKTKKVNYKVSVYLVDDNTSYRLRFWYKEGNRFLKQFERRFKAKDLDEAQHIKNKEQANDRWRHYSEEKPIINQDGFIPYFEKVAKGGTGRTKELRTQSTLDTYVGCFNSFKHFCGSEILPFDKVKSIVGDYEDYLLRNFTKNTASSKFGVFAQALLSAMDDNLIEKFKVKRIAQQPIMRDVLTEDDINRLIEKTDWRNKFKKVFLFECLTSISAADLKRLKWSMIEKKTITVEKEQKLIHRLSFERKKTKQLVTMILSESMLKMLGERGQDDEYLFPFLISTFAYNENIEKLMKEAGITKHITSHCGRATAIIRVTESEGIYVAAKQAGHADINTTLRYAQYTSKMMQGAQTALMNGINL